MYDRLECWMPFLMHGQTMNSWSYLIRASKRILGATTLAKTSFPDIREDYSYSFPKLSHADKIEVML